MARGPAEPKQSGIKKKQIQKTQTFQFQTLL